MKLIKNLGTRLYGNKRREFGEFLCTFCKQFVERELAQGEKGKSCGNCEESEEIRNNYKHGESFTNLYQVWANMKYRCLNTNSQAYKNYGGRGITICDEWLEFTPFRDWALNNNYQEGLEIDRIDNNGNYEPSNCKWSTYKENTRHRRGQKIKNMEEANEIRYLYATEKYIQKELAKMYGVTQTMISSIILNKKWGYTK